MYLWMADPQKQQGEPECRREIWRANRSAHATNERRNSNKWKSVGDREIHIKRETESVQRTKKNKDGCNSQEERNPDEKNPGMESLFAHKARERERIGEVAEGPGVRGV